MKYYYLYTKPVRAPKWWPRTGPGRGEGHPLWVGVLEGGDGWVKGKGDKMTMRQANRAKKLLEVYGANRPLKMIFDLEAI